VSSIPGVFSAERLLRSGTSRAVVIATLRRELGVSEVDAFTAWEAAQRSLTAEALESHC
jgi:hypothetical protein